MSVHDTLRKLDIELPEAVRPAFHYAAVVVSDHHAYVSGQLPKTSQHHELLHTGLVPSEVDLDQARACARLCVLQALAVLQAELGDDALDRVTRVVQVTGFVASTPEFADHPKVIDAASELLTDIFGARGRHARVAVGVAALPRHAPVEIAFTFQLETSEAGAA